MAEPGEELMQESTAVEVVKDLSDIFKHRHRFYWSTYYKLFFYHLVIVSLPYVIYHFLKGYGYMDGGHPTMVSLLTWLSWALCGLNLVLIWRSKIYLGGEDLRLRIVHKAIREIYLKSFGINLYPETGALQAQAKCAEECNNNQGMEASIAGHMERLFVGLLMLVSVLGAGLFTLLASTLPAT
ncbi:MAG: hypothetical protein OQL28_00620 [Sedimenticola sp.]|nr:hypothetical protein [Sedimenticola sp.]